MTKLDLQDLWWSHSLVGVAIVSKEGIFEDVNDKWCELLGYTAREMRGMSFVDITHPSDAAADLAMVREVIEGEREGYVMFKKYLHKMGYIVWAQLKVVRILDEDGNFHAFFSQIIPSALVQAAAKKEGAEDKNLVPVQEEFPWRKALVDTAKIWIPISIAAITGLWMTLKEYLLWKLRTE